MSSEVSPARKSYWSGTHRTISPTRTIQRFAGYAAALGITRIADVTGLDYLGIPVVVAIRPNSKSVSVSQGKGLDKASAFASALMEAAELAHAESVALPSCVGSFNDIRRRVQAIDPALLPRTGSVDRARRETNLWTRGVRLADGDFTYVPLDLVHLDFTKLTKKCKTAFFTTSNGLASGNHRFEAVCAAICETIERDAMALLELRDTQEKAKRRIVLKSVHDPACRSLLERLERCGMRVAVWDATTDIGVACFVCRVEEAKTNDRSSIGPAWGGGCHLNREVALARAITEAVQSRLTYIVGARDDLDRSDYGRPHTRPIFDLIYDLWEEQVSGRLFDDIPTGGGSNFEDDVKELLSRLRTAGLDQVVAIDLTNEEFGIPVVRVLGPGLESHDRYSHVRPMKRARALKRGPT